MKHVSAEALGGVKPIPGKLPKMGAKVQPKGMKIKKVKGY